MERAWRTRRIATIVLAGAVFLATACTSEQTSSSQTSDAPTTVAPATDEDLETAVAPTAESTSTTPDAPTTAAPTPTTTEPVAAAFTAVMPDHIRHGSFGLVSVIDGVETTVVETPVDAAFSDGAGGYLYRIDDGYLWRPAGSDTAIVGPTDSNGRRADVVAAATTGDGRPAVIIDAGRVTTLCDADFDQAFLLAWLDSDEERLLGCGGSIGDGWSTVDGYASGRTARIGGGEFAGEVTGWVEVIDDDQRILGIPPPQLAFDDCCDVHATLSPDGTEAATWFRDDLAGAWRDATLVAPGTTVFVGDPDGWIDRLDTIDAVVEVLNLDTGAVRYASVLSARSTLTDFDGRHLVVGPHPNPVRESTEAVMLIDTAGQQPPIRLDGSIVLLSSDGGAGIAIDPVALARGDIGPWVTYLQQQLVAGGADIEVDGRFGPASEAAVIAAQEAAGLPPTGEVDDATWSALT